MSDPIQKLIDWQQRSQDLEKLKEKVQAFRHVMEDIFVDAMDEAYHKEERRVEDSLIPQESQNHDPRKAWIIPEKIIDNGNIV